MVRNGRENGMTGRGGRPRAVWRRAAALVAMLPGVVNAQQIPTGSFDLPRTFSIFNEYCTAAMQGLEVLKPKLPVPGPAGEQVYAVSPDGNLITYQTARDEFLIIGAFRYHPNFVLRECMVQQIVGAMNPGPELVQEFLSLAPKGDGITMTGGRVSEQIPPAGLMALAGMIVRDRYEYLIYGAMQPQGTMMLAGMADGNFRLNSYVAVPR